MNLRRAALLPCLAVSVALAATHTVEITIDQRAIKAETNVVRITQNAHVELRFSTDEAVTLHLHGYDIEFEVVPDKPSIIEFEAFATGRFPISSHGWAGDDHADQGGHDALLYLEVYPR